jgi:hypothetical protein
MKWISSYQKRHSERSNPQLHEGCFVALLLSMAWGERLRRNDQSPGQSTFALQRPVQMNVIIVLLHALLLLHGIRFAMSTSSKDMNKANI